YFEAIDSGRRNYSAVPLAVTAAGIPLMTGDDVQAGRAFSADFTGAGWHTELGLTDIPIYGPREVGHRMAAVAMRHHFSFFEHWITDYVGHRGTLAEGRALLEKFDAVLGGLLEAWDDDSGLMIITSDHGNLEDLSHRHHTINHVPTIVIGRERHAFANGLASLAGLAPKVLQALNSLQ
ncbi:MAG: hypothetical protein ACT4QE_02730, partial [Anaerolineales bacterium]